MPLHILKLSVGVASIDKLRAIQEERIERMRFRGEPALLRHITRYRPRRMQEILSGGSIYWVIKGFVRARQRIIGLESIDDRDNGKRCAIFLDSRLVATELQPRRPHQGWRYLESNDAPDDAAVTQEDDLPPELVSELEALGLI